ncbi:hypothetical protein QQF64_034062 [Cirrhinus molitorella]|uniref:DDE Tnp4 domain-containing protein n=1 Tax=Cirrhinus molitorella TaxID=172907 RepID=A0ABR3MVN0_9TELE
MEQRPKRASILAGCRLVHKGTIKIAALRQKVIELPDAQHLNEVGHGFENLANSPSFSKCVGAIDGCHVRIKTPAGPTGQDYINRKLFPSIQTQAVCDGKGKFLNVFVGYPGSVHDTRVLKNSKIYKEALYPPQEYFLVGDGGYPCIIHPVAIITLYQEPVQGRVQIRFNHHHSKARSIIERVFGVMKTRWRCLLFKSLEVEHTFAPTIMVVCAVLHNICLTTGDIIEATEVVDDVDLPPPCPVVGDVKKCKVFPPACCLCQKLCPLPPPFPPQMRMVASQCLWPQQNSQ